MTKQLKKKKGQQKNMNKYKKYNKSETYSDWSDGLAVSVSNTNVMIPMR